MARRRVIITITDAMIEVAVGAGTKLVSAREFEIDPNVDIATGLKQVGPQLTTYLEREDVLNGHAVVLLATGQNHVFLHSCARSLPRAARATASELALAEAVGEDDAEWLSEMVECYSDPDKKDNAARVHTLIAACRADDVRTIGEWVTELGMTYDGCLPADAVLFIQAIERAAADPAESAIRLFLGERSSVLIAEGSRCLRLARRISIGRTTLAEAFARGVDGGDPDEALFDSFGIPTPDAVINEASECSGRRVLPYLQPILQRVAVEAKQSYRFGLEAKDRVAASLVVESAFGDVPRLAETIAGSAGLEWRETPKPEGAASEASSAELFLQTRPTDLPRLLLSRQRSGRRAAVALEKSMWIGAIAAIGLVGADALLTWRGLSQRRQDVARLSQELSGIQASVQLKDEVMMLIGKTGSQRVEMERSLDGFPDWGAMLAYLSEATPEQFSLDRVQLKFNEEIPVIAVEGTCRVEDRSETESIASSGAALIQHYVDQLTDTPAISEVHIGATSRVTSNGGVQQRFTLVIDLIGLPGSYHFERLLNETGVTVIAGAEDE